MRRLEKGWLLYLFDDYGDVHVAGGVGDVDGAEHAGLSRVRMEVPSRTDWRTTGSVTPAMVTGWSRLESSTLDRRWTVVS